VLLSESGMRDHPLTPMRDPSLVRVLQRQTRHEVGLVPFNAVSRGRAAIGEALAGLRSSAPELVAYVLDPMLRVTLVPTRAWASPKENVIPSRAEVLVDCRVPPGMDEPEIDARIASVLDGTGDGAASQPGADPEYELDFVERVMGNRSPTDTGLATRIQEWLAGVDPGAVLAPVVMPGFSDSHWFREAFDSAVVYGFAPQRRLSLLDAARLVHAADERAAVADVELSASFYRDIARAVLR
jgi:acetylornithine deacetylase/succinyl-diaminopimelate desuccinylase-like protein